MAWRDCSRLISSPDSSCVHGLLEPVLQCPEKSGLRKTIGISDRWCYVQPHAGDEVQMASSSHPVRDPHDPARAAAAGFAGLVSLAGAAGCPIVRLPVRRLSARGSEPVRADGRFGKSPRCRDCRASVRGLPAPRLDLGSVESARVDEPLRRGLRLDGPHRPAAAIGHRHTQAAIHTRAAGRNRPYRQTPPGLATHRAPPQRYGPRPRTGGHRA